MSVDRSAERLLQWYPANWRKRYGEELAGLLVDMSDGRRLSWRLRADVAAFIGHRRQFMIPVRAPAQEVQDQVDFAGR